MTAARVDEMPERETLLQRELATPRQGEGESAREIFHVPAYLPSSHSSQGRAKVRSLEACLGLSHMVLGKDPST